MKVEPQQLKAFLMDANLVTEAQFEQAQKKAEKTKKKIGDVLIAESLINQEELIKLEAYILGIPFVLLEKEIVSPEILKIIPEPIARSNNIIAFRKKGNNLEVAMLDPEDLRTIEFIKKTANLKILPRLTTPKSIKNVLLQYQKTLEAEFGEIIKKDAGEIKSIKEDAQIAVLGEKEELQKIAGEVPVIRIVDTLLKHAILQRSSDIHIEPTEKEVVVRYRIDGILHDAMVLPKTTSSGIVARIKVLSNLRLDEHRLPQDGRFKIESEEYRYSIRVSILPVFDGEKIVMRLLSETAKAYTLEGLGLRGETLEGIQDNLRKPVGMILVCGPTGSGKTTTLYSVMEILNTPGVNISTVEDPIEYRMPRINQTQVNSKIGLTFASGLRSLVRQDPDIIMVGEIRDNETAALAINAALTGHLVLSTLHTTDAAGAIPRLIDMKAEPFLISSTLNVVLAQRLVRKLHEEKEEYTLLDSEIKDLEKHCDLSKILEILKKEKLAKEKDTLKTIKFYRAKISEECPEGYKGRIGIYEVLPITETIKELIVKEAASDQIQAQAQQEGMRTMTEDGFIKAAQGITSIEEVLRVIIE
ncbi:Flp pilus assembly complex ATPase component TadA [Patescibacteria group bacterium]|nr:Flp pilus assembly complex ATPase component TadA [Patescibacteria group bacterium]